MGGHVMPVRVTSQAGSWAEKRRVYTGIYCLLLHLLGQVSS